MAYNPSTNTPNNTAPDLSAFFEQMLSSADTGTRTRMVSTGVSIGDELRKAGFSSKEIAAMQQQTGLDFKAGVGYGQDENQKGRLLEVINTLREIRSSSKDKSTGNYKGAIAKQLSYLGQDARRFGVAEQRAVTESLTGFAGLSGFEKADKIRAWQVKNPGKAFTTLVAKDQAKALGLDPAKYTKEDQLAANDYAKSEKFQQYNTAQDIFRTGLEIQRQTQLAFQDAQKRINEKGYAKNTIDQAFKPAETQLNQYYNPTEGNKFSQAGMEVGAGEAALGRTGSDRVAAELGRQKGLAIERFGAQKSAAIAGLQQQIDFQNPAEALRYGMGAGQNALAGQEVFRNNLLNPYAAVFPMMAQNQQANLMPFSMQQQVQKGPSALDYGLAIGQTAIQGASLFA